MVNMFSMFESNIGSMVRGALCAATMLVACDGVWGMVEDVADMAVSCTCYDNNKFLKEYANYGFEKWKADGERFLSAQFVKEFAENGVVPLLNDGRPEFLTWVQWSNDTLLFFVGWGYETRNISAKSFIESMIDVYSGEEGIQQVMPVPMLPCLLGVLVATENI
jgi:hypothetical protein